MMTHALHAARARSLFIERIVWVVIRRNRWARRGFLVLHKGDKLLCAFRNGVRLL